MAFRLRRGTDAERLLITPLEGELIYVTDHKTEGVSSLFVGDGITVGGNPVDIDTTELLDLSTQSIANLGDVDIGSDSTIPTDGDVLAYHAASGDWRASTAAAGSSDLDSLTDVDLTGILNDDVLVYNSITANFERETFRIKSLRDVDTTPNLNNSVLVYDNLTSQYNQRISLNNNIIDTDGNTVLNANLSLLEGDVRGNILAEDSGIAVQIGVDAANTIFTGDLNGNVFGDLTGDIQATDGTVILDNGTDGTDAILTADVVGDVTGNVIGDLVGSVFSDGSSVLVDSLSGRLFGIFSGELRIDDSINTLYSNTNNSVLKLSKYSGTIDSPSEPGNFDRVGIAFGSYNTAQSAFIDESLIFSYHQTAGGGYIALSPVSQDNSTFFETALELDGNAATMTVAAPNGTTFSGSIKPGVYADAAARDAAITSPSAGEIVFVTDVAKFQGYDGTSWTNLN